MVQGPKDAVEMDAQIKLSKEEFALGTGQRGNYAVVMDAQMVLFVEECALDIHAAKVGYKRCSSDGCTNLAQKGGVCIKHGAMKKRCSSAGCTNRAQGGGVYKKHGAYRNEQDESTAFGSELEKTTTTRTLPNQRSSRSSERGSVPEEVTILCQEIVEV